jgi:hypothetical protein
MRYLNRGKLIRVNNLSDKVCNKIYNQIHTQVST